MRRERLRWLVVLSAMIAALAVAVGAQDRVILVESAPSAGGGERSWSAVDVVREIEITNGGRSWSTRFELPLPRHYRIAPPVALVDGSRVLWLAYSPNGSVLVQYDVAMGRAAVVDIGTFHNRATLVADQTRVAVYIVEPRQIVVIDTNLRKRTIEVVGDTPIAAAQALPGRLILSRYRYPRDKDGEVAILNVDTGAVERIVKVPGLKQAVVSTDGVRLYAAWDRDVFDYGIDLISLANGSLLARRPRAAPLHVFNLDERRGVLMHEENVYRPDVVSQVWITALDANSLQPVGRQWVTWGPYMSSHEQWQLVETPREHAVLLYSRNRPGTYTWECGGLDPRVDVYDGRTYEVINTIRLGRCGYMVPLPPR